MMRISSALSGLVLTLVRCGGTHVAVGQDPPADSPPDGNGGGGTGGAGSTAGNDSNSSSRAGGSPTGGGHSGGGGSTPAADAEPPLDEAGQLSRERRAQFGNAVCRTDAMEPAFRACNECICRECNDYKGDIAGQGQMGNTHAQFFATECMQDSVCVGILNCAQRTHCDGNTCPMKGDGGCGDIILPNATYRGAGVSWSIGTDCLAPGIKCLRECGPPTPMDAGSN